MNYTINFSIQFVAIFVRVKIQFGNDLLSVYQQKFTHILLEKGIIIA